MLRGAVDVATSVASVYGVYQTQRNHQHALHHSDELHQQAVTHSNDLQGRGIAADTEAHFQQLIACAAPKPGTRIRGTPPNVPLLLCPGSSWLGQRETQKRQ